MKFWQVIILILFTIFSSNSFANKKESKSVSSFDELLLFLPESDRLPTEFLYKGKRFSNILTDVKRQNQDYFINKDFLISLGIEYPCKEYTCNDNEDINIKDIHDIDIEIKLENLSLEIKDSKRELPIIERMYRNSLLATFRTKKYIKPNTEITETNKKVKITNRIQYSNLEQNNYNLISLETNIEDFDISYQNKFLFNEENVRNSDNIIRDRIQVRKKFSGFDNDFELKMGDFNQGMENILSKRIYAPRGAILEVNQKNNSGFYNIKEFKIDIPEGFEVLVYIDGRLYNNHRPQSIERTIMEEIPLKRGINFIDFKFHGPFGEYYEKNIVEKHLRDVDNAKVSARVGLLNERTTIFNDEENKAEFVEVNVPWRNLQFSVGNNRYKTSSLEENYFYQKAGIFFKRLDYEFLHSEYSLSNSPEKYKLMRHKFNYLITKGLTLDGHYILSDQGYRTSFFSNRERETLLRLRYKNHSLRYLKIENDGRTTHDALIMQNRFNYKYLRVNNTTVYRILNDQYYGYLRISPIFRNLQFNYFYSREDHYLRDWRINLSHRFTNKLRVRFSFTDILKPIRSQVYGASLIYNHDNYLFDVTYRLMPNSNFESVIASLTFGFDGNTENHRFIGKPRNNEELLIVKVFNDVNENGIKDDDEEYLEGVGLKINQKSGLVTDENGEVKVRVSGTENAPVRVSIATPPNNIFLKSKLETYDFILKTNRDNILNVPFSPYGQIYGKIDSTILDNNYKIISVLNENTQESFERSLDADGIFIIDDLRPGVYTINYKKAKTKIIIPSDGGAVSAKISQINPK